MKYETRLMNIRQPSIGENHAAGKDGFMEGHRDARHAAALIGCEADAEIERLRSLTMDWRKIESLPKEPPEESDETILVARWERNESGYREWTYGTAWFNWIDGYWYGLEEATLWCPITPPEAGT